MTPPIVEPFGTEPAVHIGVDIGGTKTLGVTLKEGVVVGRAQIPTRIGAQGVAETVTDVIELLTPSLAGIPAVSLGIGIPGVVDTAHGIVTHAVNLDLTQARLGDVLSGLSGLPVAIENDVNAAALGACNHLGSVQSLALLNLGTGLAVGVVLDGAVYRGASAVVGEVGHLPIDPTGEQCACGQRGCLELEVSGSAFRRLTERFDRSAEDLVSGGDPVDPEARRALDRYFDLLAWTIQLVALSLDVERIVLSGGITSIGGSLLRRVVAAVQGKAAASPFLASLDLPSRVSLLDPDFPAGAVGAALCGAALAGADREVCCG